MKRLWLLILVLPLVVLVGCGPSSSPMVTDSSKVDVSKYELKEEPKGAMNVIEARNSTETDVVVAGRIGGRSDPITTGKAIVTLIDLKYPVMNICETPWDFCEVAPKERNASILTVKLVDEKGQPLPASIGDMFQVKELAVVVVRGKAQRDEYGNVIVLATGLYVRER